MAKLVDRERLAKLAKALDARAKAAVAAEKDRAMAAEQALQEAIDAINNGDNGILAEAKAYADEKDAVVQGNVDAAVERVEVLEGEMDAVEGRADALEAKVGHDVDGEEAATGLFAEVDEAKAAADAAQADVDAVEERLDAEGGLVDRIEANEAFVAAQPAVDAEQDRRIKALEDDAPVKQAAIEAAQDAADAAQADVDAVEERLDAEGGLVDRIEAIEASIGDGGDLEERVAANEAKLAGLEEVEGKDVTVQNAIDKAQADAEAKAAELDAALKSELQAEIDADVKVVNDELEKQKDAAQEGTLAYQIAAEKARMDAFMADADVQQGAVDTLKELQEYIDTHGEAAQKMVDDIAANKAAIEANDGDITALQNADVQLQQNIDAKVAQADYDVKVEALEAEDARIAGLVAAEEARAKGVEEDHEDRIATNEAFVAAQPAVDQAQDDRIAALEAKFEGDESVAEQIADALQAAKDYADEKDAVVQGEVDALEAVVGKEAEGENPATGIFAKMAAMQADIDQNEADCDAAMEAEVEARNQAIADALEPYSTTEEVKTILGNVVATLNLSMVDDKVVLKLGGAEGIAISEVSLDLATDEDIDAMIAALDEPAGE